MIKPKEELKNIISKINTNDNSLKSKLIYGIFWNLINALASQGFPMIAAIVSARILGTGGYGQLGMINSTIILFSTFAGMGLGITSTRYVAQYYQTDPEKAGRIIGLTNLFGLISGSLMCMILFVMAPWLASTMLKAPQLGIELQIASILLILNTLLGVQSGSITGFGAFKDLARIAIYQGIIASFLTITGVYFFGLTGAVITLVLNSSINLILYRISIRNLVKEFKIKIDYLKSWKEKDVIWKLSLPSMLSSIMIGPIVWIANIIIVNSPNGYEQLGIFNAAYLWKSALGFIPLVIGGVLLPLLSSNMNNENKSLEMINVLSSWVIVIIIALPLISFPEIIAVFYGDDYSSTIFLQSISLMMLVSCILSYKEGIGRKLITKELMWWGFMSNMVWGILFILSVLIFKNLGSLGLSLSYIISYTINTLIFVPFYLSRKVVPKKLLVSPEVFLIWVVLIVQTTLSLMNITPLIRLISLIISIGILIFAIYRIWISNKINYK